ncbi:imelysin family protein [Cognatishimia sp. WU-CL00825]|uniref:imelysin family protein n=1 Tax=Cognatishimia sp. WU-CL00825 TaxID=3127658 RepID=UPI00310872AC
MLKLVLGIILLAAKPSFAAENTVSQALDQHVLPAFDTLARQATTLHDVATMYCAPDAPELRAAYAQAFDAWVLASHLRIGPSEEEDRAFAIAFWPDTKGFTAKGLNALLRDLDPAIYDPAEFKTLSIAVRGLYALEFLLFDPAFQTQATADYRCDLVQALTQEIRRNATAINWGWQSYQSVLRNPAESSIYQTEEDSLREIFKALHAGLQFTSEARLGRPLGSFERPRPNRAEARRSKRSLRHVTLSLEATYDLALLLSGGEPQIAKSLQAAFERSLELSIDLNDPEFAGVADPAGRFRVDVLRQSVDRIREIVTYELAPALGVSAGFNSLDGD